MQTAPQTTLLKLSHRMHNLAVMDLHCNSNELGQSEAAHEVDERELGSKLSNVKYGRGPCELVAPQVQVSDKTIH